MAKVLIVTGSVRPNSVNGKVVELVRGAVEAQSGAEARVADLGEINLPFYNGATPPSVDDFEAGNEAARNWSELVKAADAVVLVSPEYNHGLSGIQKNAIDWLYHEWTDKPMLFVAYGWYAGEHSLAQLQEISTVIKWKALESSVGLKFTQDIDLDGNVLDENVSQLLAESMTELVTAASPEPVSVA